MVAEVVVVAVLAVAPLVPPVWLVAVVVVVAVLAVAPLVPPVGGGGWMV